MAFNFSDFQACLKQPFILTEAGFSDELQLISVDLLASAQSVDNHEAFSIVFQSRQNNVLPQKTYQLSHQQLGDMQLFIVPVGQDDSGVRYEAVFS